MEERNLILNPSERNAIDFIANAWDKPLLFDVSSYQLDSVEARQDMFQKWEEYYGKLSVIQPLVFQTSASSLSGSLQELKDAGFNVGDEVDTAAIGNEGEVYVYTLERTRVRRVSQRLVGKVLLLGQTRGLGFDIQSVRADGTARSERAIKIEVKATKRATEPDPSVGTWTDMVGLTRNEWVAAEQYRDDYFIYRVYFVPKKVLIFVIKDPVSQNEAGTLEAAPEKYRVDFTGRSGSLLDTSIYGIQ